MIRSIRGLTHSRFIRDVATLSSGKVFSAIIRIALVPVIARLYLPEHYGTAALFVSIATVLVPIGILSFPQAMVLPERDEDSAGLAALAFTGLLCFAMLLWLLTAISRAMGYEILPHLGIWIWAIPVAIILQGGLMIAENWLTRCRGFALSAVGDVTQSLTTSGMRVGVGLALSSAVWPLIGSVILGFFARLLVYGPALARIGREVARQNARTLWRLARNYRQFPLYNTPAALLFSLNSQLPLLILGWLFSTQDVGRYAMVQGLLLMALTTIGESIRRVYLHRSTRNVKDKGVLRRDYVRATTILAIIGLVPALLLILIGEPVFTWILGARWAGTGAYAAALVPWFYMQWLALPAAALIITLRRQGYWLMFQQTSLLGLCAGMVAGSMFSNTPLGLLWGGSLARALMFAILVFSINRTLRDLKT